MDDIPPLVNALTLEEKASLCSGADMWHTKRIDRLGVPAIMMADGPHGLRKQENPDTPLGKSVPAVCFPTASALASSWDRELLYAVGAALGEACKQEGVSILLGPGCNLKRSPLCGRNFEYFSEDPYLAGQMAASHIRGVQSMGIGTSLKHYAANNQETRRMSINAVIDPRALHEIYLAGFEIAVREGKPWTLMCAYNQVNGTFCCEHPTLLTGILRDAWGHEGIVMTDWGAMNQRVDALQAGCELEMPGPHDDNDHRIVEAVRAGRLDETILDQTVERLLNIIANGHANLDPAFHYDAAAHHALARRAAAESAVLLKNENDLLPLRKDTKIAVLGRFAREPRYQGAGSSYINPTRVDNAWDAMLQMCPAGSLTYGDGYSERGDVADADLICEAMALARDADVVVAFAGLTAWYEVEGLDRKHMRLPPGHDELIEAVAAVNPNTVVVLSNGSPVEMPWAAQVPAILEGHLGGQAGGSALADILFGAVNPSGKLAETFALRLEDHPSSHTFPGGPKTVEYRESIYVGYRYFDSAQKDVLFPFGHGLSYTSFSYHDVTIEDASSTNDGVVQVSFTIRNEGDRAGAETAQVYVRDVESTAFRPLKELKGFEKVWLEPGEEKQVTIPLGRRSFAYYDTAVKTWRLEGGAFEILVGASSRDIRLSGIVELEGDHHSSSPEGGPPAYHHPPRDGLFQRADFTALMGGALPSAVFEPGEAYTINTSIQDMQASFVGRILSRVMQNQIDKRIKDDPESPNAMLMLAMADEAPLRTFIMAGDGFTHAVLEALVQIINGQFLRGLFALVRALRRK